LEIKGLVIPSAVEGSAVAFAVAFVATIEDDRANRMPFSPASPLVP